MLLPLDMLVSIYMHLISAMLIFGANILSQSYVQEEIEIVQNDETGRGELYDSHIDFMQRHLYESKSNDNVGDNVHNNEPYSQDKSIKSDTYHCLLSLPIEIASLFKLSPLIKRQVQYLVITLLITCKINKSIKPIK